MANSTFGALMNILTQSFLNFSARTSIAALVFGQSRRLRADNRMADVVINCRPEIAILINCRPIRQVGLADSDHAGLVTCGPIVERGKINDCRTGDGLRSATTRPRPASLR